MKKNINIILIAVVVGLWGTICYRYIRNLSDVDIASSINMNQKIELLSIKRDTFILVPLKRDPFLNKAVLLEKPVNRSKYKPGKVSNRVPKTYPEVIPAAPWPKIEYFGYIKSGKNAELAVLKINGRLLKLHNGESREAIVIKKIYKDSITILFNSEAKTFKHIH